MEENRTVNVETILDLSHFSVGETITGSVYLTTIEPFDDEMELVVVKRSPNQEEVLDTLSLNPVGDNISKEVRKIPFMFVPDERWANDKDEKIFLQTLHQKSDHPLLGEVEIAYD